MYLLFCCFSLIPLIFMDFLMIFNYSWWFLMISDGFWWFLKTMKFRASRILQKPKKPVEITPETLKIYILYENSYFYVYLLFFRCFWWFVMIFDGFGMLLDGFEGFLMVFDGWNCSWWLAVLGKIFENISTPLNREPQRRPNLVSFWIPSWLNPKP